MSRKKYLNEARNGCNSLVKFQNIQVYYNWSWGGSYDKLGNKIDKDKLIANNVENPEDMDAVKFMLMDWELYENGWFIKTYKNSELFNYLCQLGNSSRPIALSYLKN